MVREASTLVEAKTKFPKENQVIYMLSTNLNLYFLVFFMFWEGFMSDFNIKRPYEPWIGS